MNPTLLFSQFMDFVLHLDQRLGGIILYYGAWTYALLFLIIFLETGLVIAPFLPGDSLLFATGAFTATGALNLWAILILLIIAAILGDSLNYAIGSYLGPKVFRAKHSKLFHAEYLERTRRFYHEHGPKTVVLARFMPIIRTFAPFVAGIGKMSYPKFLTYNVLGAVLWVGLFVLGGKFFGGLPFVKENFSLIIIAIIIISLIPFAVEVVKHWQRKA